MEKKRVYIVFADTPFADYQFRAVFFTEEAAKQYVSKRPTPKNCTIEIFEEAEDGTSKEIY